MVSLYHELKRRKVFRVAAVYLVVAWLFVQVADIILPTFNTPVWINQTLVIVLFLGLPIVLVVAWAFELAPETEVDVEGQQFDYSIESANQKSGGVLMGLIGLAVFFLFFDRYMLGVENAEADSLEEAPAEVQPAALSLTYTNLDQLLERREGSYRSFDFTPDAFSPAGERRI